MTLRSQGNSNIHKYVIEQIWKNMNEMTNRNWEIKFQCVKSHSGVRGNDLADTLAKESAANENIKESNTRVSKSVVSSEIVNKNVAK